MKYLMLFTSFVNLITIIVVGTYFFREKNTYDPISQAKSYEEFVAMVENAPPDVRKKGAMRSMTYALKKSTNEIECYGNSNNSYVDLETANKIAKKYNFIVYSRFIFLEGVLDDNTFVFIRKKYQKNLEELTGDQEKAFVFGLLNDHNRTGCMVVLHDLFRDPRKFQEYR